MSAEKKSHSKPDKLIINSTTGMNGKFKNRVLIAHIGPKIITFIIFLFQLKESYQSYSFQQHISFTFFLIILFFIFHNSLIEHFD